MSRYIDADKLIKHLQDEKAECYENARANPIGYGTGLGFAMAIAYAEILSTVDGVEVVRCKDCKHCHHRTIPNNERYECEYYGCSDEVVDYVEPTHYCSYGERKEV